MKKLFLLLTFYAQLLIFLGQAPQSFNYQAVIRDSSNNIINNQSIGVQIAILQGNANGNSVYTETFSETTNDYGLINLQLGSGVSTDDFNTISWENGPFFIETSIDVNGGSNYLLMGATQIMSVPYAIHSSTSTNSLNDSVQDDDADPNNELQALSLSNDTLYLSNGGFVDLSSYSQDLVNDLDTDTTNEIQTINRVGNTVTLSKGGGSFQDSINVYSAGSGITIINNIISMESCNYNLGQYYSSLGGVVIYLESNGCHGIVADTADLGTFRQPIHEDSDTYFYKCDLDFPYAGKFNTPKIVSLSTSWGDTAVNCAMACQNSTRYGFSDWYAPSLSELLLIEQFANLDSNQYFSSSTVDTEFAGVDDGSNVSGFSYPYANLINSFKILDHYASEPTISTIIPGNDVYYDEWYNIKGVNYLNIIIVNVRSVRAF